MNAMGGEPDGKSAGRRAAAFVAGAVLALSLGVAFIAVAAGTDDLLQKGLELFRAGDYTGAAASFQGALDADPASDSVRRNLASAWSAQGHALLQTGNWTEAKRFAEKAAELCPGQSTYQLLLAVILFRQGDYSYAHYAARKALDLKPDDPTARELMGDLYYQDGSLALALSEWEAANRAGPERPSLRQKIERTHKELEVEENFGREGSRHFLMQYDDPVPRWIIKAVLQQLEEAYVRLGRELGASPRGDISVILYPQLLFHEVTMSPGWVGGRFDGKVRVPVGGLTTEAEAQGLQPILTHELAHAFLRSMVPQGLPRWLEEGLAMHFEGMPADAARARLRGGRSFAGLDEVSRNLQDGNEVERAYAAAALAVHALIEEAGWRSVRLLLEDMGSGMTLEQALRVEAKLSPRELEELWRRETCSPGQDAVQ